MNLSNHMFDVIKSDLEVLEEGLLAAVSSENDLVTEVGTHLVTSGGKRIRPALCLLSAHGGPSFELSHVLPLAEALELIHTASLYMTTSSTKLARAAVLRRPTLAGAIRWQSFLVIIFLLGHST